MDLPPSPLAGRALTRTVLACFVMVLDDNESHLYRENKIFISDTNRNLIEFKSREQIAWMTFGKHIKVLLDHNISLQLQLKYFDACVGPAIPFGTAILPMPKIQLQDFDRLQRTMLRRIMGCGRIEGEDWRDTMVRMNQRLSRVEQLYFCRSRLLVINGSIYFFLPMLIHYFGVV